MLTRLIKLTDNHSFFLFGPRAAGKTTLIKNNPFFKQALYINLLIPSEENRLQRNPDALISIVENLPAETSYVVIDEVQKIPKLLDIVHYLIEETEKHFILTGSSARRLKHGGANLLAGRAFVFHLHPFSYLELPSNTSLNDMLQFGTLPSIFKLKTDEEKILYLEAYTNTYLKEEIWAEKFVRDLAPFRYFLQVAAQSSGKLVNFANIARDVGVADSTVQTYFSILEDTLIGFFLPAFQHSFRKRLNKAAKFYFFDVGVVRALTAGLALPITPGTSSYGDYFEHFIILQIKMLADYFHRGYRFSYLMTKDGAEVDLVVERPGLPTLFIEIKSSDDVQPHQLKSVQALAHDFGECEVVCFSRDPYAKKINGIDVLPWRMGVERYFSFG